MTRKLSHLDEKGAARMVDVSGKDVTQRTARARGFIGMKPETLALVETGDVISIDIPAGKLTLEVPDHVLEQRRASWRLPEPNVKKGYLARYARMVSSAAEGAVVR